jgi:hypothetical protein
MWNLNPLDSDQSSTQTDIYLTIIENIYIYVFVGILIFSKRKGVNQYNMMKKFGLHVRRGWTLSFCQSVRLFLLSLIVEIRK